MTGFSKTALLVAAAVLTASSCGFKHAKYENPITKDTQQPDKVLYDKAIKDLEKGRYEIARLTLNTLINTYDSSEYLAKAKLAVADSWYREGGAGGMAQAEAEYKDFILFYPTMEEAAESQFKIAMIHFGGMDKSDRDPNQALRAEQEFRQVLVAYPNSKYAPMAEQRLRETQETLADAEMKTGTFYDQRGAWASAANRFSGLVAQYPLYSHADEALWREANDYSRFGTRFRPRAGEAYQKIVRDYPLSKYTDLAKARLKELEMAVPDADPQALAHMKYEEENATKAGIARKTFGFAISTPDHTPAAKSGSPQMNNPKPSIPVNVPTPTEAGTFAGDITVAPAATADAPATTPATPAPDASKGKQQNNKK
ncbi:MAG TPA: outer membrane protein assembly factor BamD [Bryobacteraceae bacterium]